MGFTVLSGGEGVQFRWVSLYYLGERESGLNGFHCTHLGERESSLDGFHCTICTTVRLHVTTFVNHFR